MKKFLAFLAIVLGIALLYSWIFKDDIEADSTESVILQKIEENSSIYPVYNRLSADERDMYIKICAAISDFDSSTPILYTCNSLSDARDFQEKFAILYREIIYEQSELFWIDPYNYDFMLIEYDEEIRVFVELNYLLDKETALSQKEQFDETVEMIVSKAQRQRSTFDEILYVYDYILDNCSYDYDVYEKKNYDTTAINAYGCLVDGKTVCSGYTLAFDVIMKRLGYECGAEFNSYSTFSLFEGHVWNYCKIEDEYYYFDLTWDDSFDTGINASYYEKYFDYTHRYFGITKEELERSHLLVSDDAPTPLCNGTKYNYFVYKGYNIPEYSLDAVKEVVNKQSHHNYVALRFDSYGELYDAEQELLKEGKIYDIVLTDSDITWIVSNSDLHLYIIFEE